ncbi:MAG: diadenylate cyclase CdaA [Flavobacteriaceae bacterium]
MNNFSFLEFNFVDLLDIVLVALLLFYLYKLVKGTVAINIFLGIVIIYFMYQLTITLNMNVLSNILGNFISVGFFALIVVFQQEIRKFLLLLGSTNYTRRKNLFRYFNFLNQEEDQIIQLDLTLFVNACENMAKDKMGAIIVLERSNNLDFVKSTGDSTQISLSPQILESIFFKNSPLHDGAIIIKDNKITATRIVLPVSESNSIPSRFGLRHRAGLGISEKTDALVIVVSEERGDIVYIKNGQFTKFDSAEKLKRTLTEDLSL